MKRYIFADEAGNFDFSRNRGATKYFILCTVAVESCEIGNHLLELRRDLAWRDHAVYDTLHATTDSVIVRNEVFGLLESQNFRIDALILEKSKAQPQTRLTDLRFYHYAWYYHFKYVGPRIVSRGDELFIAPASIGTKKKQGAFRGAINDVVRQSIRGAKCKTAFWSGASDPCLWIADYCAWAIQRKWESNDDGAYARIKKKIASEYDLWSKGKKHFY